MNLVDKTTVNLLQHLIDNIIAGNLTTHDREAKFDGSLATLTVVLRGDPLIPIKEEE